MAMLNNQMVSIYFHYVLTPCVAPPSKSPLFAIAARCLSQCLDWGKIIKEAEQFWTEGLKGVARRVVFFFRCCGEVRWKKLRFKCVLKNIPPGKLTVGP